jgi:hypothetical protein
VGYFYYKVGWYPGAVVRLKQLLKDDPDYTNRDAAYYYLGESMLKAKHDAEAIPYFAKLVKEFETSEFLLKAKARLEEHKSLVQPGAPDATTTDAPATPAAGASTTPAAAAPAPQPKPGDQAPPVVQPTPPPPQP